MDNVKSILRFFLGFPAILISIILIAKILFDFRDTVIFSFTHIYILLFLLGVFFYTSFFLLKSIIWTQILKKRGHRIPARKAIYFYAVSDIKRYVPGNIISVISRIATLTPYISKGDSAKAIGIETVLMIGSSLIVAIPALYFSLIKAQIFNLNIFFFLIIFIISLLAVSFLLFRKYLSLLCSYFDTFLLFLLAWLVFALASFVE